MFKLTPNNLSLGRKRPNLALLTLTLAMSKPVFPNRGPYTISKGWRRSKQQNEKSVIHNSIILKVPKFIIIIALDVCIARNNQVPWWFIQFDLRWVNEWKTTSGLVLNTERPGKSTWQEKESYNERGSLDKSWLRNPEISKLPIHDY